jgi:hypothetical protein
MRQRHLTDLPKLHFAESCASNFTEFARRWSDALTLRCREKMDAATMRDLGISEAEMGSVDAEAQSIVERARLRIATLG